MAHDDRVTLTTERLELREAGSGDLGGMHQVFERTPSLDELRPDIAASGGYDLASVRHYWESARLDPARHVLVLADVRTGDTVGIVDFVTESPTDGLAWIGLVLIAGDRQRRGLGTEALSAVLAHLAAEGRSVVRMAVLEGSHGGIAFARSVGFTTVGEVPTLGPGPPALLMERDASVHDDAGDGAGSAT
jgi:RimJ/RimL family protein N-acetyltransferase